MKRIKFALCVCLILTGFIDVTVKAQDGQLDKSFDSTGVVGTYILPPDGIGWTGEAHAVLVQSDNKIITVGFMGNGSQNFITLIRYNQSGIIDSTFGTNGIVTTAVGTIDDKAYSAALQKDGKILVAGYSTTDSYQHLFALARYNSNGSLDGTFGVNGIVTTAVGQSDDKAFSIAIQSDGKIIAAGTSYKLVSGIDAYAFAVVRYNTSGSLDNTFGTNGVVTTTIEISNNIQTDNEAKSVVIQKDGKIIIGGFSGGNSQYYFALLRYNTDGTLDNSFGTSGISLSAVGPANDGISSVALQSDGKIIAGGYSQVLLQSSYAYVFALARYNSDGSLDNTFGSGGTVTTSIGGSDDAVNAVAIQSNGKIVAAGHSEDNSQHYRFALARYNADGTLDDSFGRGGIVITSINPWDDKAFAAALQNDGRILAAGSSQYNDFYDLYEFALVRYTGSSGSGVNAVQPDAGIPETFSLYQNYPNPFNPSTSICYQIPKAGYVSLKIYDMLGREVASLVAQYQSAGKYEVQWDGSGRNGSLLSSGVYIYSLQSGNYTAVRKMIFLK